MVIERFYNIHLPVIYKKGFEYNTLNMCIFLGCVCFPESSFRETTFQTSLCLFVIRKVGQ